MEVAVKVLRRSMLEMDEGVLVEFEREIGFMQRTRHANLVRFFGAGRQGDGTPFLVEELMAGGTLERLLRGGNARQLDWDTKSSLAADVARGMAYMHGLGHIHRDLKSGNVLVTEAMQAKVADFGSVGRLLTEGRAAQSSIHTSTSASGSDRYLYLTQGVGTPLYMSLEMLQHASYDASTDVWSFGVLLWEVASQAPPDLLDQEGYSGGPVHGGLVRFLEGGRRLAIRAEWPDAWRSLMARCWQRTPDSRPAFPLILSELVGSGEL